MPLQLRKSKRKLRKSGDKISPKDKKHRFIKGFISTNKMATSDSSIMEEDLKPAEDNVCIPRSEWKELMAKIDGINKRTGEILNIKSSIEDIKGELSIIKSRYSEVEDKVHQYQETTRKVEERLEEVVKTQELIGLLDTELKASEQENRLLKEQLLQQESYTRRDNLLFVGIREQPNEDCEELVRVFLRSSLGLSDNIVKAILISRCP